MTDDTHKDMEIFAGRIDGMVEYSEGSIVSRTVLDKTTGSITLFAFDAGQRLSEHTSPHDATLAVIDGKGLITVGGREYVIGAGEMIIMPANVPHDVKAQERFKMMLIMIR